MPKAPRSSNPKDYEAGLLQYKTLLTHFADETHYDEAQQRYMLEEFIENSATKLMTSDFSTQTAATPAIGAELVACSKLLIRIAVLLLREDHTIGAYLTTLCLPNHLKPAADDEKSFNKYKRLRERFAFRYKHTPKRSKDEERAVSHFKALGGREAVEDRLRISELP